MTPEAGPLRLFRWTIDNAVILISSSCNEAISVSLERAITISCRSPWSPEIIDAMPPCTFEFDFANAYSPSDDIMSDAAKYFADLSPLAIPLTRENTRMKIEGDIKAGRVVTSFEVSFALTVKAVVDSEELGDWMEDCSLGNAGAIAGDWIDGYDVDYGSSVECLEIWGEQMGH